MITICIRSVLFALLAIFVTLAHADNPGNGAVTQTKVQLGNEETLTELFAYPNNKDPQTLAQTIELYLRQSVKRDGLSDVSVNVQAVSGQYYAVLSGAVPGNYPDRITNFLSIGGQGYAAKLKLRQDGKWDEKNWRFYLPLGLAMANQKSAQLLHFPPDTSLTLQDYLNSATSRRWESLLQINGASSADTPLFERIVDIAPVAAPANAGGALGATYAYFKGYAFNMLNYSISASAGKSPLPVVAYGAPVRQWVQDNLGVNLPVSASPAYVNVGQTQHVPFLGANHPSYIWYVAKTSRTLALRAMRDDLVAACWQVKEGGNPQLNIDETLNQCSGYWDQRDTQVCELTEIQAYNKTPDEARKICSGTAKKLLKSARALRAGDLIRIERNMPAHYFAR